MSDISDLMTNIQAELKAPKGQFNSFGKYKYRSCEDIVEAVKPILKKYGAYLNITDDIIMLGDRFYVKATATITTKDGSEKASAYAREALDKKGMDDAQITGSASSYARKYALNGLLAIDDNKDADTMDNRVETKTIDMKKVESVAVLCRELVDEDDEDTGPLKAKELYQPLSNDERIALQAMMKESKPEGTGKTYWSVFHDHLKIQVEREKNA